MARTIICFIFFLVYSLTGIAGPVLSLATGSEISASAETGETPGEESFEALDGVEEEFCHQSFPPYYLLTDGSVDHKHPFSPDPDVQSVVHEMHTPPPELI